MDECIEERPKLLIWLENIYRKKTQNRRGKGGAGSRKENGEKQQICSLFFSDLFSEG